MANTLKKREESSYLLQRRENILSYLNEKTWKVANEEEEKSWNNRQPKPSEVEAVI